MNIVEKIKGYLNGLLRGLAEEILAVYELVILKTPEDCKWKYLYEDGECNGFRLVNQTGRIIIEFSDDTLKISGNCISIFYVYREIDLFAVQRFAMKFLRRETNVSAKFDSRFELISYDACYEERVPAKKCIGTWQQRGADRWLETEGRVVAEYNIRTLLYKFKSGEWTKIDAIGIHWDSEGDFKTFLERQVAYGAKEVV